MSASSANAVWVAKSRATREYRFSELDFMREAGMSAGEATSQLGWTVTAAEVCARRHGRRDLARWLDAERYRSSR